MTLGTRREHVLLSEHRLPPEPLSQKAAIYQTLSKLHGGNSAAISVNLTINW